MKKITNINIANIAIWLTAYSAVFPRNLGDVALVLWILTIVMQRLSFKRTGDTTLATGAIVSSTLFSLYIVLKFSFEDLTTWVSEQGLLRFAMGGILAALWFSQSTEKSRYLNSLLNACTWAGATSGLIGIFQFFGFIPTTQPSIYAYQHGAAIFRSTGLLPHATEFSIVGLVLFGISLLHLSRSAKNIPLATVKIFLITAGVVVSLGRIAYLNLFLIWFIISTTELLTHPSRSLRDSLKHFSIVVAAVVSLWIMNSNSLYILKRIGDVSNVKGVHGQRYYENRLGAELIIEYPNGVGIVRVAELTKPIIERFALQNKASWEFQEWRGIHNDVLYTVVLWGWIGLFYYLFLLLWPLINNKKQWSTLEFATASAVILALLSYSLTNLIFYIESSFSIGFTLYALHSGTQIQTVRRKPLYLSYAVILLLAASLLPDLRQNLINSTKVNSIYLDNPSSHPVSITVNQHRFTIQAWSYKVIFTEHDSLYIEDENGHKDLTLPPRKPAVNFDKFLVNIVPYDHYKEVHFDYDPSTRAILQTNHAVSHLNAWHVTPFPKEALKDDLAFLEPPPVNFRNRIVEKDGRFKPAFPDRQLWRENSSFQYSCWEPTLYIMTKNFNNDFCQVNTQWNAYGPSVLRNYFHFIVHVAGAQ